MNGKFLVQELGFPKAGAQFLGAVRHFEQWEQ